jgi:anti-sigma factor RsiW
MTERLNAHLADETLNEFLDRALAAPARATAAEHLATCAACTRRLEALQAVFSELADLPPAPLARDLRVGVMAAVRAQRPAQLRPIADPRRPAFQLIFGVQVLAALVLLAFAWPFAASLANPERLFGAGAFGSANLAAGLASAWVAFSGLWPAITGWLAGLANPPAMPWAAVLPPLAAGLILVAGGLLWLLGNALLLRPGSMAPLRRH